MQKKNDSSKQECCNFSTKAFSPCGSRGYRESNSIGTAGADGGYYPWVLHRIEVDGGFLNQAENVATGGLDCGIELGGVRDTGNSLPFQGAKGGSGGGGGACAGGGGGGGFTG